MNVGQRRYYFALWKSACAENDWAENDQAKRREVLMEAVGKPSTSDLTPSEVTAVLDHLKWLADRYDLQRAMGVANGEVAAEQTRRAQLIWRITKVAAAAGFNEAYVAKMAEGKCAAHRVRTWQELPLIELLKLSFTLEKRKAAKRKGGEDHAA